MKTREHLSEKDIISVFDSLGLGNNKHRFEYKGEFGDVTESRIMIARISDSTIPMPSGEISDANMERPRRRD